MKYLQERNLSDFPFWSGGEDAMERISSSPDYDEEVLEQFLQECFFEEIPTEGQINDFIWFEEDYIMETLGWRAEEEEEEEDDDED